MSFDDWKLAYPPEYDEEREPGCLCGEADYCPVHGCFPEDDTNDTDESESEP